MLRSPLPQQQQQQSVDGKDGKDGRVQWVRVHITVLGLFWECVVAQEPYDPM